MSPRRELILSSAGRLFHDRGYDRVSMGEIAQAAGVGPSALYRHFPGKSALLGEVVGRLISDVMDALIGLDLDDPHATAAKVGALAEDYRLIGVLWEREARHLEPADLDRSRAEVRGFGSTMSRHVARRRPDLSPAEAELLAWASVCALNSMSFHHLSLPGDGVRLVLGDLTYRIVDAPISLDRASSPGRGGAPSGLDPASRREALLLRAVPMFARHGYSRVSMEDVGAAVGIAGPSVYNHFATKEELLVTAMNRGIGLLYADLHHVLARTDDPRAALDGLLDSYLRFALDHHDLLELLISEVRSLGGDRRSLLAAQRDYVTEWTHLVLQIRPDDSPVSARIRVHAVLTVINDLVRMPRQRGHTELAAALRTICVAMLDVGAGARGG